MPKKRRRRPPDRVAGEKGSDGEKVRTAQPVSGSGLLRPIKRIVRQVISEPNFGYQFLAVLLTLTSDNYKMDRRISHMSTSLDTLRNVTGVVTNTMESLKVAVDAPRQIRKLVNPEDG